MAHRKVWVMGSEAVATEYGSVAKHFRGQKLSELCVDKAGIQTGPFGSQLHKDDYVLDGTPIITVEHLAGNRISHEDLPNVSDEDKERLAKYHLATGDLVFSRVGSVDRNALVGTEEDGWLFSGRCLRIRVDQSQIDPRYLSHFFSLEGFKEHIRSVAVGATMPSINTKILSDVTIYAPPLPEQKAIAHILGSLDDKIELNRRMNATLEGMAQALFKSWFVDFDPVIDNALAADNPIPDELAPRAEVRRKVLGERSSSCVSSVSSEKDGAGAPSLSGVLIKADLRAFLSRQYAADHITPQEIEAIIKQLEGYSAADLYESNKAIMKLVSDGFLLKREDHTQKDLYIQLIDYSGLVEFRDPAPGQAPSIVAEDKVEYNAAGATFSQNIFKIVNQLEITGSEKRIPDCIL